MTPKDLLLALASLTETFGRDAEVFGKMIRSVRSIE